MAVLLSIIVPIYQVEAYIKDCIESICRDTKDLSQFELILVNDGTKDNSMSIAISTCQKIINLNFASINQENQGLSAARMNGLAIAKGEYIWFIDSDDYLTRGAVDTMLQTIRGTNSSNLSIDTYVIPINKSNDPSRVCNDIKSDKNRLITTKEYFNSGNPVVEVPHFVFKRKLTLHRSLYFPIGLVCEDVYFVPVLLYLSNYLYPIDQPLYNLRHRDGSIMRSGDIRTAYDTISVYRKLLVFVHNNVAEEDKTWFFERIIPYLIYTYTNNKSLFGSRDFHKFKNKYAKYILFQSRKSSQYRKFYNQIILAVFLFFPLTCKYIVNLYRKCNFNLHNIKISFKRKA